MSTFPSSLDNLPESHADGTGEVIHASTINNLASAVNAVESAAQPVVNGASANVTAANLNALTGGGQTSLHSHAGGGPSSGIQYRDVQLNDAQIKALPTTRVELIPAPGEGLVLLCGPLVRSVFPTFLSLASNGDYTNQNNDITFQFTLGDGQATATYLADNAYFFAFWGESGHLADSLLMFLDASEVVSVTAVSFNNASRYPANAPLWLAINNPATGDFTGGDPANTLSIRVWYSIVPAVPFGA